MDEALVEHGCIDLLRVQSDKSAKGAKYLAERVTNCFANSRLILLGRTLLDSG